MSLKKARAVLLGGMGFPATETPAGMFALRTKLEAIGFEVLLVNWKERTEAYNFAHGWTGFLAYFGDSLGAGSSGEYPGDLKRQTNFAGGFQPSEYDERTKKDPKTGEYYQLISTKILVAHCVFDPWWIDTGGLGYARWREAEQQSTKLIVTEHRGAHPDDWGTSQTLLLSHMQSVMPK